MRNGVGIATGWTGRVRCPALQDLSLLHSVQTGSGTHPASYLMGAGATRQEREADNSPHSSSEVKNGGAIPPIPHVMA
jgi:hypothetical protein